MLIPYAAVLINSQDASPLWAVPMLIWGNRAFRHFANANRLGSITVPVKPLHFLIVNAFGSMVFAAFGILIIPALILFDAYRLFGRGPGRSFDQ